MPRTFVRILAAAALACAGIAAPVVAAASPCAAAGPHHAAIVVEHGDGTIVSRCVAFSSGSVTGEQLLQLSGVEFRTQTFGGFGDAICQVDGEPARYTECLGTDRYWAYFVARAGGGWQFATAGISNVTIHDGDAEGFRYEPSSGSPGAPPSPWKVCQDAVAAPTPTPKLATPRPARTIVASAAPVTATGPDATATASAAPEASSTPPSIAVAAPEPAGPASPAPSPPDGELAAGAASAGLDPGLLAAAIAALALVALVVGQALARRRR